MSKITKETILDSIDFEEEDWGSDRAVCWTTAEITNAMVAAYNRALEDVGGIIVHITDDMRMGGIYREDIEKLKVG